MLLYVLNKEYNFYSLIPLCKEHKAEYFLQATHSSDVKCCLLVVIPRRGRLQKHF